MKNSFSFNKINLLQFFVLCLLSLASNVYAQSNIYSLCKTCKKLDKAEFIGIKNSTEYIERAGRVSRIATEKKARKRGLSRFKGCAGNIKSKKSCAPVYSIFGSSNYYCPSHLVAFKSESKAVSKGYKSFTACNTQTPIPTATPTPTATPAVTALPLSRSFQAEDGIRFSNVDAISITKLINGNYRSYISPSVSSTDPDIIYHLESADGLTFNSKTALSGLVPAAIETFAYPYILSYADGTQLMFYERIKHVSSAGLDFNKVMRSESSDGTAFTDVPEVVAIPNGSAISSPFKSSVVKINSETIRLYYQHSTGTRYIESNDKGLNWGSQADVIILGRSDNFAPYPDNINVVQEGDSRYLMFFSSPLTVDLTETSIFMAESTDGIVFHTYDTPLKTGTTEFKYQEPTAILLPDAKVRLYYLERNSDFLNPVRTVKSLLLAAN